MILGSTPVLCRLRPPKGRRRRGSILRKDFLANGLRLCGVTSCSAFSRGKPGARGETQSSFFIYAVYIASPESGRISWDLRDQAKDPDLESSCELWRACYFRT
ncbi:Hypothetical predicted protein [Podarcis lilfordi]|uniref:Uncharacterized protein n=1 Tax=Podarcis lilfordi TaxID=74358 RepID=A0AA35P146_9SAUR|nr:Hypothetical predicted protein [Podarcis lilfordi]